MPFKSYSCKKLIASIFVVAGLFGIAALPAAYSQPKEKTEAPKRMSDAEIVKDLRTHLEQLAAKNEFSGAVLFAKDGKVLFEHAYGYADHAFLVPNKVDTKFNLGSMGKMFTAVSILQLAQAGKISLDDKLIKDLPDYPNKEVASKITIYQLLTHTSGLSDMFTKEYQNGSKEKYNTEESYLPLYADKPLLFEPGTKWSYSNAGMLTLGLVIQHVSGESYFDYVREHIFKPTGMINTDNYDIDDDVPNLALGYTMRGVAPGGAKKTNHFFLARGTSAGGGYSTVEDLLHFSEALQGHKLLNKEYTDLDMTGHEKTSHGDTKYAFGLEEQFINGVRIVGHSGGAPGIASNLDMYPGLGYTVAIMTNSDGDFPLVNNRLRMELTGQELPKAIHLSAEELRKYAGKYQPIVEGRQMGPMELTVEEGALLLGGAGSGPMKHKYLPLSATEFFEENNPGARITFTKDANGQVTEFTMTGVGPGPLKATKQQ